jgi:L-cysteine:1D-myo-inositol 2-amino-2-deoxy-alpha-D-glucopyranoside ligase
MSIRLAILSQSYREDWPWSDELLLAAQDRLHRWRSALSRPTGPDSRTAVRALTDALADNLDTPRALAVVDGWAREQELRGGDDPGGPGLMSRAVDALLGVA